MLKKRNRISKKSEFDEIKKMGFLWGFSRIFGVVVLDKKDDEIKFGMVISKKISKRAVDRNKIRRRLMEVLGKNLDMFEKGKRILFLVKKELLEVKPEEIEKEMARVFRWKGK